jgi:hypothetical protein
VKQCAKCKQIKLFSEFNKKTKSKDGCQPYCRDCSKATQKEWHIENPSVSLLRNYGITIEQKLEMIASQDNRCAICKEPFVIMKHTHVDHCHGSTKIRGILCNQCNTALGSFKDSPLLLQSAINYLEKHATEITATPVSEGSYIQGAVGAELGSVSTPWTWKDSNHTDNHSGTVPGQDANHSAQKSSGDSVAHRNKKVEPSPALTGRQDNGDPEPKISSIKFGGRHLFS